MYHNHTIEVISRHQEAIITADDVQATTSCLITATTAAAAEVTAAKEAEASEVFWAWSLLARERLESVFSWCVRLGFRDYHDGRRDDRSPPGGGGVVPYSLHSRDRAYSAVRP